MLESIDCFTDVISKIGDIPAALERQIGIVVDKIDAGDGTGELSLPLSDEIYYETLAELTGLDVTDKTKLFKTVTELADVKRKYEKVADALSDAQSKGYGIVMPTSEEMKLDEPRLVKQANGYGVKVSARAESIHMIKTGIRADLCPMVGTAEQSEEVVKYLISEYEDAPEKVWESNMFGKSLYDLVSDGMKSKLEHMPDESREKLGETLERIINEGAGGLLCILL
jgi:stage IV sporulation protein A